MCGPDLSVLKSAVLGDNIIIWEPLLHVGCIIIDLMEISLVEFMQPV